MSDNRIRFEDGAGYERMMGKWSQLVGEPFLDWLALPPGLRFADIGCGNGAFTELIAARCAPAAVDGIDPSEGQLAFARQRPVAGMARFQQGDAMALPFVDGSFDAALMALVLFFVPDPARAVQEMRRVTRPGGCVAAYLWDFEGGGFPLQPIQAEMRAMGLQPALPPSVGVAAMPALQAQWQAAALHQVETRVFTVERRFDDFDSFWETSLLGTSMQAGLDRLGPQRAAELRQRVKQRLAPAADGSVTYPAHANAIKGIV